jgi:hypothetical protein
VAAAEVLDEGVPGTDDLGRAEPFESAHRPQPSLEPSMIGSIGLLAYCSVIWHAAGASSSSARG